MRVALHTMGCRSNHADSTELQLALSSEGAIPCEFSSDADVYVINTCTVTDSAEREVRSIIRAAKKRNGRVVVTGCLASVGSPVFEELTEQDAVVAPGQRKDLLQTILSGRTGETIQTETVLPKRAARNTSQDVNDPLSPSLASPGELIGELPLRKRFHLRVQEGCDHFCTFCIIPYTRGKTASRSPEQIFEDLKRLADLGYEEVVLTGTHLGGYGADRGTSLLALLEEFARRNPIKRVRLSSLDPNDVSFALIDLIASERLFCEHLHICLQSLDDEVLKRMNRRHGLEEGMELLDYAREKIPSAALGTDLITGFPGESAESFERQSELLAESPLSYVHVFPYSERSGTAATRLDGEVALAERKRRADRLRAIAGRKSREFARNFLGKRVEMVLEKSCESSTGKDVVRGTTREFLEGEVSSETLARLSEDSLQLGRCVELVVQSFDEGSEVLRCELFDRGS